MKRQERTSRWEMFFASIIDDMPNEQAWRMRAQLGATLMLLNNEIQDVVRGGVRPLPESKQAFADFLMRKRDSMERIHKRLIIREKLTYLETEKSSKSAA